MIVILCEVPASGKSRVAKGLCRRLEEMDLDYELFASDEVSRKVYERVFRFLRDNVGRVENLVVDATFYKKKWREEVREIAGEDGEDLLTVHLHCSLETSLKRNDRRKEEYRVSERAIHIIYRELEKPDNPGLEFDTDETDPEVVVDMVVEKLT
ncbi:hypothetical protein AKJ64_02660 [candidate division MSBL1 archaeon SCGC-AAA259E17]|uniref:ATP-binding protein n=1 Tax=candidate division MSBL1 archaeon SCGC-AAA259E17 TaxID=1698263 RepID=A0A133UEL0_9EURY|nr:hypothetical protein AKJ64_02660 [candidate division MSBL1 archaeon SCGC-AAA259E17]